MMNLKDKCIIVTGASSGIGAAAAELFAREGAKVILGARRGDALETVVGRIREAGGQAKSLAGDVTEEGYAKALVDLAMAEFGMLNGAFDNAGMVGELSPVGEMATETWNTVLATNLTSAFFSAKYQIPAMIESGGGSLIFTGSFVGVANAGLPGMAAYAASKAGLVGLVQSLAMEHGGSGVRVNALLPGGTKTAMAGDDPSVHDYIAGLHPLGRIADPFEIAEAARFLLSDAASFVTGSAMAVDGGVSVRFA